MNEDKFNLLQKIYKFTRLSWVRSEMLSKLDDLKIRNIEQKKQNIDYSDAEMKINIIEDSIVYFTELWEYSQIANKRNLDLEFINLKLIHENSEQKKEIELLKKQIKF